MIRYPNIYLGLCGIGNGEPGFVEENEMECPECGAELLDDIDEGLGIPNGGWYCPKCGWESLDPDEETVDD